MDNRFGLGRGDSLGQISQSHKPSPCLKIINAYQVLYNYIVSNYVMHIICIGMIHISYHYDICGIRHTTYIIPVPLLWLNLTDTYSLEFLGPLYFYLILMVKPKLC